MPVRPAAAPAVLQPHVDREGVEEQEQGDEDRGDEAGDTVPSVVETMSWAAITIHGTAPTTHP